MYAKKGTTSQDVCEHLSMQLPPSRSQFYLYELHLAEGNFLSRRLASAEDVTDVYESFPDQTTPFPYKSMFALREKDITIDIKTTEGNTMHVRVKAFETCAKVIERIVSEKALANKSYEIHEVDLTSDGSSLLPKALDAMYLNLFLLFTGFSRKIKGYEALADVVGGWKNTFGKFLEFRAPQSMAAVRILLWDGSFKAVPISAEQTCKLVLKNLSDKIMTKKWWQLSLFLVSANGTKRKIEVDEILMSLLQADSESKLFCEETIGAQPPKDADAPENLVDPAELVDPALERHGNVYLRLRAASYAQRSVELFLSTTPEPKSSSTFQYIAAESVFTLQVDVATTAADLFHHLSTVVMPSFSPDYFKLVVRGPRGARSDFLFGDGDSITLRKELRGDDSIVGALQVVEALSVDPADVQLVVQFSPPPLDPVELDSLEDEANSVEENPADSANTESVIVFFNKESFVQLNVQDEVTIRWALNSVASLLGVDSSEYALFETGGGQERLLDESTRLTSILQAWKLSSQSKSRALSFKRKTSSVRESIRMGLSTHNIDLSSISMLPRGQDAEDELPVSGRQTPSMKRKKTFSRLRTSSSDAIAPKAESPRIGAGKNRLDAVRGELAEESGMQAKPVVEKPGSSALADALGDAINDVEGDIAAAVSKPAAVEKPISPKSSPRMSGSADSASLEPETKPAEAPAASSAGSTASTSARPVRPTRSELPVRRTKGDFGSLRDGRRAKNALAGLTAQSSSGTHVSALEAALDNLDRVEEEPQESVEGTSDTPAKTDDAAIESQDQEASLDESSESNLSRSSSSSNLARSSSSSGLVSKSPTWLLSETDVPQFGGIATQFFSHSLSFDSAKIASSIAELATDTKRQLHQLKYFEEHGPPLAAALQAQLKAVILRVRDFPAGLETVAEEQQDGFAEDCRSLSGAVCAFLELLSYATDSSIEEQTGQRVQFIATLLAKVLQLVLAEQYEDLPEIGAKILGGAVRVSLLLRIRSHLAFTDDTVRLLRRVALQIKQSAYSLAGVIKAVSTSQSLEDIDSLKQEVRSVATLLQQVPQIAKSEASSTSESTKLLPEKSLLMTRLYKAIKDLFGTLGSTHEQLPALQTSLQAILEAIKKVNEGGLMPSIPKFLKGVVEFSAAVAAVSAQIVSSADKGQQDTREKAEALENAVLIERVQLIMLANIVVSGPGDSEKLDLLLHYVGALLQLLVDNFKKTQPSQ
jgi:hypothetical protein